LSDSAELLGPALELAREQKIYQLLPGGSADDRLEASGVCVKDGCFYVIFDNSPHIARLASSLTVGDPVNALLRQRGESAGFEDVTYHQYAQRFLIIIESLIHRDGAYRPNIEEYDDDFRYLENNWVDFALAGENKGMEGLAYVHRDGQDYVLGLCEGNKCKGGKQGRKPGGGRIQIFQKGTGQWDHKGTIKLPKAVRFRDYASLDVDGNRIAVVSQITSALWIGAFREDGWGLVDDGVIYLFPRNESGETIYCNIEGVSWITPRQIVVVSDKSKPGKQSELCRQRDQSIHIFDIPDIEL
jgi:hypothetical protein